MLKRKAKFYKQEIDPSLNIDEVVIGSSVPNSEKQAPPKPQPKQRPAPPKPSASAAAVRKPVLGDVALFLGNLAMVICIALAIQPFNRFLAYRSFVNACRFSVGVHGYRVRLSGATLSPATTAIHILPTLKYALVLSRS